jgi:hypothetical protein
MDVRILGLLLLVMMPFGPSVSADEILVITSHDTPFKNISPKRLENIFLRKILLNESGDRWIPLNLTPDHPSRRAFSLSLFNRSPAALESYWNEQYFQGITPPYVVASEEAMVRFVASTRGAIGYILPCHLDDRVQVVFKVSTKDALKQYCYKSPH